MPKPAHQDLLLASSSPRRQELIQSFGLPYIIRVSDADETVEQQIIPRNLSKCFLYEKHRRLEICWIVQDKHGIIIGSDTVVVYNDEVLGKPVDEQDAFRMLKAIARQYASGIQRRCLCRCGNRETSCVLQCDTCTYEGNDG